MLLVLGHLDRPGRHRERAQPGGAAERLLRAGVAVVDVPLDRRDLLAAQRRDAVGHQQRLGCGGAHQRTELGHRVPDAGRGLGVHHGDELRVGVGLEGLLDLLERHDLSQRRGELHHVELVPTGHLGDPRSEEAGMDRDHGVAGLGQVRESRLHAARAARREAERQAVGPLPERLQAEHQVEQDVPEVRVEMAVHLERHRFEDLGVHVGRSGAAEQTCSGVQGRDAGDERIGHGFPPSSGTARSRRPDRSSNGHSN